MKPHSSFPGRPPPYPTIVPNWRNPPSSPTPDCGYSPAQTSETSRSCCIPYVQKRSQSHRSHRSDMRSNDIFLHNSSKTLLSSSPAYRLQPHPGSHDRDHRSYSLQTPLSHCPLRSPRHYPRSWSTQDHLSAYQNTIRSPDPPPSVFCQSH